MMKWTENEELDRECRNGKRMRKWSARQNEREEEYFISVFPSLCCKTLKISLFDTTHLNVSLFVLKC